MATDILLTIGIATAVLFVAILLVEGARRPDYDPRYHTGSELELGERGWVQRLNFLLAGVGTLAFALGVFLSLESALGSLLLAAFGLGFLGSGLFLPDPVHGYPPTAQGAPQHEATWQGKLHNAIAPVMFFAVFAACLTLALDLDGVWQLYTLATAGVGLVLTILTARAFMRDAGNTGLIQRALIIAYLGWVALLGLHLS
jgi:hypothetical protein